MTHDLKEELEKLTAWTRGGCYVLSRSTYETDRWNKLVEMGLVERAILSNLNQYRIKEG